ncbi:MAG: hypothetical protein DWP97_07425 [Calditrichaeota bacterium]|nr:MAG: hypothetical protein DWP97_07425 [Calditrichota bacterium]
MKINHLQSESGAALVITLTIMALLFMVALSSVDRSDTNVDMTFNQVHEEQAFYIAEAGAKRAFIQLNESNEWRDGYYGESYGEGTYTVTVLDSISEPALLDTIIINSIGKVDGAEAVIVLEAAPRIYNPFRYALYADELVDMRNSFETDSYNSDSGTYASTLLNTSGDVGSNGIVSANN